MDKALLSVFSDFLGLFQGPSLTTLLALQLHFSVRPWCLFYHRKLVAQPHPLVTAFLVLAAFFFKDAVSLVVCYWVAHWFVSWAFPQEQLIVSNR